MIDSGSLAGISIDVTLPAEAPARLALPPEMDGETWWQIGDATWLRALPGKSVLIRKPDGNRAAQASFRSDYPGLTVDEDADWVNASADLRELGEELMDGVKRQLAASVPALPTRATVPLPSELQLDWPAGGPDVPEARRLRRMAGLVTLTEYTKLAEQEALKYTDTSFVFGGELSARLLHELSAIPRPAEARLQLSSDAHGDVVLSWDQSGNPDLMWGAAAILWDETSRAVQLAQLSPEEVDRKRRLGSFAHLLAMATAVEAATGGIATPLRLSFCTVFESSLTATLIVLPEQWGFDLPHMVHLKKQAQVPDEFHLRIED